jgi:hypothetical protein
MTAAPAGATARDVLSLRDLTNVMRYSAKTEKDNADLSDRPGGSKSTDMNLVFKLKQEARHDSVFSRSGIHEQERFGCSGSPGCD